MHGLRGARPRARDGDHAAAAVDRHTVNRRRRRVVQITHCDHQTGRRGGVCVVGDLKVVAHRGGGHGGRQSVPLDGRRRKSCFMGRGSREQHVGVLVLLVATRSFGAGVVEWIAVAGAGMVPPHMPGHTAQLSTPAVSGSSPT